ncbi:MAG: regulatory protein RecX [Bacteroidales bacterium]
MSVSKNIGFEQALSRAMKYCAYQERCRDEVLKKLIHWGLQYKSEREKVLAVLEQDNFLDEYRFALHFSESKLKQNQWGKLKISAALKNKNIAEDYIHAALANLPEEQYWDTLVNVARKKIETNGLETREQEHKLKRYLQQKGFEFDRIEKAIKEIIEK